MMARCMMGGMIPDMRNGKRRNTRRVRNEDTYLLVLREGALLAQDTTLGAFSGDL